MLKSKLQKLDGLTHIEIFLTEHMKDLKNMYQIKRHEKSIRIIYKIGVLNEKRCKKTKINLFLFFLQLLCSVRRVQ